MANTLTSLIPDLYESLDTVSRELVGFIPAVAMDANAERAAVGQTVRSFVAPASTAADITPGQLPPNTGDQTIGNKPLVITKARAVPVRWNGEEQVGINSGSGYGSVLQNQFAQAMRTLTNEVEVDLATLYSSSSRAFGTAATTPFGSNLSQAAEIRQILVDNGAPQSDMQLVINTSAGTKLRSLTTQTNVNEAGSETLLRQGILAEPVLGMSIRESAGISQITKGTGTSYTTDTAGYSVGDTVITLITGSGTVVAGDVVTFAGDTNKYVVSSGVAAPGAITLAAPGLQVAITTSATAMTIGGDFVPNMAFHRNAIQLVTRAPAIPAEGDQADDATVITDPRSGLSFEVRLYKEYRQIKYEVALAWGFATMKDEHTAILLG